MSFPGEWEPRYKFYEQLNDDDDDDKVRKERWPKNTGSTVRNDEIREAGIAFISACTALYIEKQALTWAAVADSFVPSKNAAVINRWLSNKFCREKDKPTKPDRNMTLLMTVWAKSASYNCHVSPASDMSLSMAWPALRSRNVTPSAWRCIASWITSFNGWSYTHV